MSSMKNALIAFLVIVFLQLIIGVDAAKLSLSPHEANTTKNDNSDEGHAEGLCELHDNITSTPRIIEKFRHRFWPRTYENPRLAYKMAILSSMSYFEFHRWSLLTPSSGAPSSEKSSALEGNGSGSVLITGFRLKQDSLPRTSHRSRLKYQACRIKAKAKSFQEYVYDSYQLKSMARDYVYGSMIKGGLSNLIWNTNETSNGDNRNDSDGATMENANVEVGQYQKDNSRNYIFRHNYSAPYVSSKTICKDVKKNKPNRKRYTFQYWLYNWYEPTFVAGVHFHDTDLLISTSDTGQEIVISFGGTASPADAVTNLQTFEFANHSKFFGCGSGTNADTNSTSLIQGSILRGFLNAYSRVVRGYVLRINPNSTSSVEALSTLHNKFGHCRATRRKQRCRNDQSCNKNTKLSVDCNSYDEMDVTADNNIKEKRNKGGGCKVRDEKLVDILRSVCVHALENDRKVRLTGHSLGGGLASLLALDLIINFPNIPISNLDLWTFGAPQIADDLFYESAMNVAPRLESFVESRIHRYVTTSDKCKVDAVSEVAKNTLPSHKENLHGKFIGRKLGGVHGQVVHLGEPIYLLTPEQYNNNKHNTNSGYTAATTTSTSTTRSSFAAHELTNYLKSISRISRHHPLSTDLPPKIAAYLGESI